ncbi:unnamed protein product [Orchesella dallaii]|uniref:Uncharacterized protein n=1 Tax=Orchesella dallaii TaxID=48710 RepID=A0ABP1RQV0_9HEXA
MILTVVSIQLFFAEMVFSQPKVYVDALNFVPKSKGMFKLTKAVKDYVEKYDGFKVDSLDGLGDFLKPVQHCFIHMTNFGGVDLPSLSVPSIQMQTNLAVYQNKIYAISNSLDLRRNVTFQKCPLSRLFADSRRLCVAINFRKFVTKTRPWICEIIVSLFQKQVTILKHRNSFSDNIQIQNSVVPFEARNGKVIRYIDRLIPSYAPINILIHESDDVAPKHQNLASASNVGIWFKYSLNENLRQVGADRYTISRDTYLVASVVPVKVINSVTNFSNRAFKIDNVVALLAMPVSQKFDVNFVNAANIYIEGKDRSVKQKYSMLKHSFDAYSIYAFIFSLPAFSKGGVAEQIIYHSICKNDYLNWATTFLSTTSESYSVSLMGEWLQILRRFNYTISVVGNIVSCKAGHYIFQDMDENLDFGASSTVVQLDNKFYPTALSHPIELNDPSRKIGFIACGSRPFHFLAFRELFWVFDMYVWICLCLINFTIIPASVCLVTWLSEKYKSKRNLKAPQLVFSSRIFFQPVIILLEQGSAFTAEHLKVGANKWIAAALILVTIVLSNSYKYDNVYNMMLPRKSTPLWFFQELLSANFNIYTRTNFYKQFQHNTGVVLNNDSIAGIIQLNHTITFIDSNSELRNVHSEVVNIFRYELVPLYLLYIDMLKPWDVENVLNNNILIPKLYFGDLYEKLLENTKLHSAESELSKTSTYNDPDSEDFTNKMKSHETGQTSYLTQLLNECQNTAIILPLSNIRKLISVIRNQGHTKLTVGKEVLLERSMGMALKGWISDHLISTLGRIQDYGIWHHVRNLCGKNITSVSASSTNLNYRTPQISGNVLVVFTTLLFGDILAFASFVFEIRKRICCWMILLGKSLLRLVQIWSKALFQVLLHVVLQVVAIISRNYAYWFYGCV